MLNYWYEKTCDITSPSEKPAWEIEDGLPITHDIPEYTAATLKPNRRSTSHRLHLKSDN